MDTQMSRCKFNWRSDPDGAERHATANVITSDEPIFETLNDLLRGDECLVLRGCDNQDPCEMQLTIAPLYLVRGVSIIVECPVIEVYYGRLREYNQTYHGELIYSVDDGQLFRYDVRITSDINELHVKFIMNDATEPVCLYTTRLYLTRNTDPLRTIRMMAGEAGRINPVAVQHRLQGTTLSDRAEKFKYLILGSMLSAQQNVVNNNIIPLTASGSSAIPSGNTDDVVIDALRSSASIRANNNSKLLASDMGDSCTPPMERTSTVTNVDSVGSATPPLTNVTSGINVNATIGSHLPGGSVLDRNTLMYFETIVKQYIDEKFVSFEKFVDSRLAAMEAHHDRKLDRVIELLQKGNKLESDDSVSNKSNQEE